MAMKILICSLMLTGIAVAAAIAGDAAEMLRERLTRCNQFVIEDPRPAVIQDALRYCCRSTHRRHDCHVGIDEHER